MSQENVAVGETESTSNRISKRWLGFVLALLFALGAFFSGLQVGQGVSYLETDAQGASIFSFFSKAPAVTEAATEPDLSQFWSVWKLLEEKFAVSSSSQALTDKLLVEGAIKGLVGAYSDPYTVYMSQVDTAKFDQTISGNFSGVGMEVGLQEDLVTVIAPLPGSPAERAGVIAGDVVVKINDQSTERMTIDEAVNLIRGEKGTVVTLQIYRKGETEFIDIPITRDTIIIPTVKFEELDDAFYISLYSFNAVAETQVVEALKQYLETNNKPLILDVRGNPGGYLQSAVAIAGYFLPAGKVVVKEEFSDSTQDETFRSRGRQVQLFTPKNLVVLVDNGSASASEILAGALKDHGVATVIGSQTFGKGSVQEFIKLDDGSSLKVTVARWLTPNGTSISEGGLTPDIVVERTVDDRQAGIDLQKEAALRFLSGEAITSETYAKPIMVSTSTTPGSTGE